MKQYLKVQSDRKKYHLNPLKNTVHRSSLLAPTMQGAETLITFINHFLIKRNYKSVALKISAIDQHGNLIDSNTSEVFEKRVYTLNLTKMFSKDKVKNFLVEFFSDKNLFVPFPAVIVSHTGKDFCNVVHSFNRILNDVFENDQINYENVAESSIDVINNEKFDTFFNLASGMKDINGFLNIAYEKENKKFSKKIKVSLPRLSFKSFYLSKILPKKSEGGTIKIEQPKPEFFFGRMLAGRINKKTGAFSANHSFYDSSKTKEYFNSKLSYRTYPFFKDFSNKVVFYPIISKCDLDIKIDIKDKKNNFSSKNYKFKSNSKTPLEIDISEIVKKNNLKNLNAFTVTALSSKGKVPTRINHQLIYGGREKNHSLDCSINVSLTNDTVFTPKNKKSFVWGSALANKNYKSNIGFCFKKNGGLEEEVEIDFYSEKEMLISKKFNLKPSEAKTFNIKDLIDLNENFQYVWYVAKSLRPDLNAYSVHKHNVSENSSGEHNF